jgi:hypothetical protein
MAKHTSMPSDQELARAELEALVQIPGFLKIITAEVKPEFRKDPKDRRSPLDEEAYEARRDKQLEAIHAWEARAARAAEAGKAIPEAPKQEPIGSPYDPRTFVCHDVVSIEPDPAGSGKMIARSAEGDWCMGYPTSLSKRLREWRGA